MCRSADNVPNKLPGQGLLPSRTPLWVPKTVLARTGRARVLPREDVKWELQMIGYLLCFCGSDVHQVTASRQSIVYILGNCFLCSVLYLQSFDIEQ